MSRARLAVLGLAVACLFAGPLAVAEEVPPPAAAPEICPPVPADGVEGDLPEQPLEGAVFASPGLCPTVCPVVCPSTWTCSFGNCVCD
jgi:hypothetical protein